MSEYEQRIITMAQDFIDMDGHIATLDIERASEYISGELGLEKAKVEKIIEREYLERK